MKYILSPNDNEPGIRYGRYLDYLETIKGSLPAHVAEFASSKQFFTLDSPHSLHDAWLNSVEVRETRRSEQPREPTVTLTLKLLGQYHDRVIVLEYENVFQYRMEGTREIKDGPPNFQYGDTFHGDVITHEVRLGNEGHIIHEIAFATESALLVECLNFTHREEIFGEGKSKHGL